jgi:predicted membrane protein
MAAQRLQDLSMDTRPARRHCFDTPAHRARRALFGLSVIGVGALALLDNLHLFDIALLRTFWPAVFVVWGLARLAWPRHLGHRLFGLVLILAGALMIAHNLGHASLDMRQWWPVLLILAGVSIALRGLFPHSRWGSQRGRGAPFDTSTIEHADEVNVDASFSGVRLQNDSRSFKGGKVAVSFGGLELDLREAGMDSPEASLDIHATFSGIEIRVPRDWQVSVQMSTRMGAVEDKTAPPVAATHRLVLRGEIYFGGVEIKN